MSESIQRSVEGDAICGEALGICVCTLPPHPDSDPHVCGRPTGHGGPCGGSWSGKDDGTLVIHAYPDAFGSADSGFLGRLGSLFGP